MAEPEKEIDEGLYSRQLYVKFQFELFIIHVHVVCTCTCCVYMYLMIAC